LDPGPTDFAPKIGLGYTPPPGSKVEERRNRGRDVLYLLDASEPPGWTITFQRIEAERFGETVKSRIDALLAGLTERQDPAKLSQRSELKIRVAGGTALDAFPAELIYLDVPFEDGRGRGVSGLLVIQTTPYTFLYGTLFAQQEAFENGAKADMDALFQSLRIQPVSARRIDNAARIEMGSSVLDQFTPEVLRAIAAQDEPEFYRLYEEGPEGEIREIGWQRLTTKVAPISAVSGLGSDKPDSRELGLLVTIEGEIVSEFPNDNLTIDIVRQQWISFDRLEERWSVHRTPRRILLTGNRRIEKEVGTPVAETGLRTRPQPRSTVMIVDSDGVQASLDVPVPPQPFISQTELYVLGRLLKEAGIPEFDVDWYVLDQSLERGAGIRKRSDLYSRKDGTTPTADFHLDTRGPSGSFSQSFSSEDGTRIKRKTPFGANREHILMLEKIEPAKLIELYKSKNLPIR
jgi:hypothetical protein